jgi:hypothetical protein
MTKQERKEAITRKEKRRRLARRANRNVDLRLLLVGEGPEGARIDEGSEMFFACQNW